MKSLKKPDYLAKDVFLECLSNMNEGDLKKRLTSCASLVEETTLEFERKKINCELHQLPNIKVTRSTKDVFLVDGKVTVEEMKDVYTNKFAAKDSPGRPIYDKIFSSVKFGLCPFCSHRQVKSIDHYLPKANYPALSVSPSNLVPCCLECNFCKNTNIPIAPNLAEEELLHPYFDSIEDEQWLYAEVQHLSPPVIVFYVRSPEGWNELLAKRTVYNFKALSLNNLYSTQASLKLVNIQYLLKIKYREGGMNYVRNFLLENGESYRMVNKNSWEAVFYDTIGNDDWFCDGGFDFI